MVLKRRDMIWKRKRFVGKRKDMILKRKRFVLKKSDGFEEKKGWPASPTVLFRGREKICFDLRCIKESEKCKFTSVEFQVSREQQQNNNNNNNVRETRRSL
jgi:hypothetical protein